jgi:hypothetical protein
MILPKQAGEFRRYNLTVTPFERMYSLTCRMVNSPKWKMEAANTASALPTVTASPHAIFAVQITKYRIANKLRLV